MRTVIGSHALFVFGGHARAMPGQPDWAMKHPGLGWRNSLAGGRNGRQTAQDGPGRANGRRAGVRAGQQARTAPEALWRVRR